MFKRIYLYLFDTKFQYTFVVTANLLIFYALYKTDQTVGTHIFQLAILAYLVTAFVVVINLLFFYIHPMTDKFSDFILKKMKRGVDFD